MLRYRFAQAHDTLSGIQLAINASNLADKTTVYGADYGCTYGPRRSVVTTLTYTWK